MMIISFWGNIIGLKYKIYNKNEILKKEKFMKRSIPYIWHLWYSI